MMEKKIVKNIKIWAWVLIAMGAWSSFSWTRLLLSPEKLSNYIANLNRMRVIFTPLSSKLFILGIIGIMLINIITGILLLKQKEKGRKLFIVVLIAFPSYHFIWLISNLIMKRSIGLFIVNTIIGIILCGFLIRYLTRPKVKEQFR